MAEESEDAPVTDAPQLGNLFGGKKKKAKSVNHTAAGAQKTAAPVKTARADGEWKEEETAVDMVRIGVQVESLKLDEDDVKDEKPVWNKGNDAGESTAKKGYYPALSATAPVASTSARQANTPAGVQGIKSERSKFDALQEEEEAEAAPVAKKPAASDAAEAAKKAAKKEQKRLEKEKRDAELREEAAKKAAEKAEATVTVKVDGKNVEDTKVKIDVDACQAKYDGRRKPRPSAPLDE